MSETVSHRRVDIIAVQPDSSSAIIIDPTIRWEIKDDQPISVHKEKCSIYEPTIQYYRKKYHLASIIEVVGLMIGARGTIPDLFKFCRRFKIQNASVTLDQRDNIVGTELRRGLDVPVLYYLLTTTKLYQGHHSGDKDRLGSISLTYNPMIIVMDWCVYYEVREGN